MIIPGTLFQIRKYLNKQSLWKQKNDMAREGSDCGQSLHTPLHKKFLRQLDAERRWRTQPCVLVEETATTTKITG